MTIAILNANGRVVRQVVLTRTEGGAFTVPLSLKRLKRGRLFIRVSAVDRDGATATITRGFTAR
jgi:hypothetical protein